jgi:hypothetical protein
VREVDLEVPAAEAGAAQGDGRVGGDQGEAGRPARAGQVAAIRRRLLRPPSVRAATSVPPPPPGRPQSVPIDARRVAGSFS